MPGSRENTRMRSKSITVLAVDDDPHVTDLLERVLVAEGYRAVKASNASEALAALSRHLPDLILLDVNLPGADGFNVCHMVRQVSQVPIIMVSARDDEDCKVKGLRGGADDYVTKPFSIPELVARVRALLRRSGSLTEGEDSLFSNGPLVVDFGRQRVSRDGDEIRLSATEYRLLSYLCRNAGHVLNPDQILSKVWGNEYIGYAHLLRVNMARLRHKLGDCEEGRQYIVNRPGVGYMMLEPDKGSAERQLAMDTMVNGILSIQLTLLPGVTLVESLCTTHLQR